MIGLRKLYTIKGINRLECTKCGMKPAYSTWQICAYKNLHVPICKECDIKLNEVALRFLVIKGWEYIINEYKEKLYQ